MIAAEVLRLVDYILANPDVDVFTLGQVLLVAVRAGVIGSGSDGASADIEVAAQALLSERIAAAAEAEDVVELAGPEEDSPPGRLLRGLVSLHRSPSVVRAMSFVVAGFLLPAGLLARSRLASAVVAHSLDDSPVGWLLDNPGNQGAGVI